MKTITAAELKNLLDKNNVTLIDVREPAEHRSERIEGASLIPLGEVSVKKLPSKLGSVVVCCRSGKRSFDACAKLLKEDPDLDICSLEGGILSWQEAGFNITKSGSKILPLDRQTQFVVGFISFLGTILGAIFHDGFYIVPGFISLGLMFAGLSGWCGMAKLLAKMPWNR